MSFDPIDLQISKMSTSSQLVIGALSTLNELMTRLADKLAPITKKFKEIGDGADIFRNLKPVTQQVNKSKFKKGVKAMGGLMKTIAKSSIQTWAIAQLMKLLQPLINMLSLFNPIFDVLGAIIQEALLPVIIELLPYIKMATKWLLENKDSIILLINVLFPLLGLFHLLKGNFDALQFAIVPLTTVLDALLLAFKTIGDFISLTLGPTFESFLDWMEDVEVFVEDASGALEDFVGWIDALIEAANSWNPLGAAQSGGGGGGGGGISDPWDDFWDNTDPNHYIPGHAAGGITASDHIARVGEGGKKEAIIPLETSNPVSDALEEMVSQQQKQTRLLEKIAENSEKQGLNRRKFG